MVILKLFCKNIVESDLLWDNAKINDVQGCIVQVNLWTWKFLPIAELVLKVC